MQKRYERFISEAARIKDDVSKRNEAKKMQSDIDTVVRFQQYQKEATGSDVVMLEKVVKLSGLHMEEVLRRQRRKKKFFYDQMQEKFGGYWNSKVQELSKAKYVGNEGVPGATRTKNRAESSFSL